MPQVSEHPSINQNIEQEIYQSLRTGQKQMAQWRGGRLAVSAVPGAGKSTGIASTIALTIAREKLNTGNELVVVTFTRAAAANIKQKIKENLRQLGLPKTGFSVHTLHGLAYTIASRYPQLSGLNLETSTLVTPNQNNRLIRNAVEKWIAGNPQFYQVLLQGREFDSEETERLRRQSVLRTEILPNLATTVIKEAKCSGLSPADLRQISEQNPSIYHILEIASGLYQNYNQLMEDGQLIDYDDMILAGLKVLENDWARQDCQNKIYAVFEDEAQDSSPLQTKLLEILATTSDSNGILKQNLVRVGDPNQAINSTFTPADPIYFRTFCQQLEAENSLVKMVEAGRSTGIIMEGANLLLEYVNTKLARTEIPFQWQKIEPVSPDSFQKNPQPEGRGLEICYPRDINETVHLIAQRTIQLFNDNPDTCAAVLVRENKQSEWLAAQIKRCYGDKLRIYEVNQEERRSHVPGEVLAVLQFLSRPHSPDFLKTALRVFASRKLIPTQDLDALASKPEEFMYPGPLDSPQKPSVIEAREFCCRLLQARMELPTYHLIPFLASCLNYQQSELATADKLAERIAQQISGEKTLTAMIIALTDILNAEKFEPVQVGENMESIYTANHQLTIITMHKAKGLDWDYVFLPFLQENNIPGKLWVSPSQQFLGDFTLAEVARSQIRCYLHHQPVPDIIEAWEKAKDLKTAEEYRLLYVAMTRAKKLLWMAAEKQAPFTWNKPDNLQTEKICPIVPVLSSHVSEKGRLNLRF